MPARFPLTHWSAFRFRLHWAYERIVNPGGESSCGAYNSVPMAAWLIRTGAITLRFGEEEERLGPGAWIFPREGVGLQEISGELRLLSLRFEIGWVHGTPLFDRSRTAIIPEERVPELAPLALELVKRLRAISPANTRQLIPESGFEEYLALQPLTMQWVLAYYRALLAHGVRLRTLEELDERTRLALHRIETQPLALPLPEEELARSVGWSRSQLNRQFLRQTGATPAALWNRRRLQAARSQLLHGGLSIKEIAFGFGFSSPEHFTRWFGRQSGLSPSAFRRSAGAREGLL